MIEQTTRKKLFPIAKNDFNFDMISPEDINRILKREIGISRANASLNDLYQYFSLQKLLLKEKTKFQITLMFYFQENSA